MFNIHYVETVNLPRQARDKHKETLKKRARFFPSLGLAVYKQDHGGGEIVQLEVRKRVFLRHFILKTIVLPRQARDKHREAIVLPRRARDKHRESTQKETRFLHRPRSVTSP
jgi:hypothetical protein